MSHPQLTTHSDLLKWAVASEGIFLNPFTSHCPFSEETSLAKEYQKSMDIRIDI